MNCLRCGEAMRFLGSEQIQLGKAGLLTGVLSNVVSGSWKVTVYQCSKCGKMEFYNSEEAAPSVEAPQRVCPQCGFEHDFDYPKCPKCGHDYY